MYLQLIEDTLTLPEDKPDIYKIADMKVIAKVIEVDKIVPSKQEPISISIVLEIQYQLSYTSKVSKNRIFVTTYQDMKTIYLTSEDLESQDEANKWDEIKIIEATLKVEDIGSVLVNNRDSYTYVLLSISLNEIITIEQEEERENE